METILVTGGTGFVGNHVVRRLCEAHHRVKVFARKTSPMKTVQGLPVEVCIGDLLDRASLDRAVQGCTAVFHVAADYRLWAPDPRELFRNNVEGTENVMAAAKKSGVQRIVYTSTVGTMAFSKDGKLATEEAFPVPSALTGAYKQSKFLAEQVAFRYASDGLPVVIVNPSAPVGEGDFKPTDTGKIILNFLNRRLPAWIDTGLCLTDIRDVAQGHLLAWQKGRPGQRYILGGTNMSFKDIMDTLAHLTGLAPPLIRLPHFIALAAGFVDSTLSRFTKNPPRIPLDGVRMARYKMYVSSEKAERELGYRHGPIEPALERAIRWFQENGMVTSAAKG